MVMIRVRSLVWFVTGAMLATAVTLTFVNAWRVDAAPGETDATFVPITPCRLVDTRAPGRTALFATETRTFTAHGPNGACTIPDDAVGLSMNVTADQPSAQSFWTFWPDGVAQPTSSNLNPAPGEPPTPNAVTTPISSAGKFNVYNDDGTVDIIIDINGYYTKASLQELAGRLAAAEAAIATNTGNIATNQADIAALKAAQPFIVASDPIDSVEVQMDPIEIRRVTVSAPVTGRVAVIASGYMTEDTPTHITTCGLMDTVATPPTEVNLLWTSAGTDAHLSASRVFDISEDDETTYYLVCETAPEIAAIGSPQVTAIFIPTPTP